MCGILAEDPAACILEFPENMLNICKTVRATLILTHRVSIGAAPSRRTGGKLNFSNTVRKKRKAQEWA